LNVFCGACMPRSAQAPTPVPSIRTATVSPDAPELAAIKELWRQDSATLGFFPQGAFADYAEKGGIISAADAQRQLVGYLAFRRARQQAVIVHLCVQAQSRNRGVARALFSAFQDATADLRGARVTCRKDFAAVALWPKLGFLCVSERPAREEGKTLQRWWLDYGHPNLFRPLTRGPLAILDANVFFDLQEDEPRAPESHALRADWLDEAFMLALTPEIYNEISRDTDESRRSRNTSAAGRYEQICGRGGEVTRLRDELAQQLGPLRSVQDESDVRQLAHAIACDATFFITRDGRLLDAASALLTDYQINVLRPAGLISRFDESANPSLYSPSRLDGSSLATRVLRASDIEGTAKIFCNSPRGERASTFASRLRTAMSQPGSCRVEIVEEDNATPICLIDASEAGTESRITSLRSRAGSLGATVAMHMLWRQVVRAESRGADSIKFCDPSASDECLEALQEVGFVASSDGWVKRLHRTNYTLDDVVCASAGTRTSGGLQSPVGEAVCLLATAGTPDAFAEAERIVWPGRIRNSGLPCYVVPIQPRWAGALFDSSIAAEHLFPSDPSLLLRFENVYYRSAKPEILRMTPARVLWYVSDADSERHSKQIRASSLIRAVEIDTAKNVFRRYRRYGVFDWEHVRALARGSNGPVMAFSFSHTTLLKRPIPFADASSLLKTRLGKTYTFQSPVELPEDVWIELHELANK
jgi:GNAT superfamily N-acetyltransferase/predicted nucleic acid-binding protein